MKTKNQKSYIFLRCLAVCLAVYLLPMFGDHWFEPWCLYEREPIGVSIFWWLTFSIVSAAAISAPRWNDELFGEAGQKD